MTNDRSRRRGRPRLLIALLAVLSSGSWAAPQQEIPLPSPAQSLFDPRLKDLRLASVAWGNRQGPRRQVVDVVCLVPDMTSFLEAIGRWDSGHAFPILIEDTEQALRFLRAFQPSRVVRYVSRQASGGKTPEETWKDAVLAVGQSWRPAGAARDEAKAPRGDEVPAGLGPTPPGVVVSQPASPSLAGAVALAAGRFQPLMRWEPGRSRDEKLSQEDAIKLALDLETKVSELAPKHGRLGDDCDFLTLAGYWPWKFDRVDEKVPQLAGEASVDDLLGRVPGVWERWAYVGRLQDDERLSVYQAMCSLFLHPESALLFNGYDEEAEPWATYRMDRASRRLSGVLPTVERTGPEGGSLNGWHRTFDPINQHGLVLVNSSGSGDSFSTRNGGGATTDVPMSVPAALLVIHSFSAVDPGNTRTIAGRWLLNGAFCYFGSMNEPFLQSFRTPTLEADLLAEGLPISAVTRKLLAEDPFFGSPWRLHLLGDPLYRLDPKAAKVPRLRTWAPLDGWPSYDAEPPPPPSSTDLARLRWALEYAIARAGQRAGGRERTGWEAVMLSIDRPDLPAGQARQVYDDLMADLVTFARRGLAWNIRVDAIPVEDRSDALKRSLDARSALGADPTSARRD
jgi:hypothetical protein